MKKILSVLFCLLLIGLTAMPAFAESAKTITEVRLTVTEPVVGEAPDMTIESAEPDKYTATVRYWIKRLYGSETVVTFEEGYEYGLVFDVTPADGYKFADVEKQPSGNAVSATIVYMNDQVTDCVSYESETNLGRVYAVTPIVNAEKPVSFFQRIINAIRDFFTKIANFFKNLFGLK